MKYITPAFFCVLWLVFSVSSGLAKDVVLPLTLDHKLLQTLLLENGFSETDHSASVVGTAEDCTYIKISEPRFSEAEKLLNLEVRLDIRAGTQLGDNCITPLEWHGYLELLQQPIFDGKTFSLSFRTVDSKLLTLSREPATIAGFLWNFAKPRVYERLDQIHFDLAPPVAELRSFLLPVFPESTRQATQAMLDSLRGGQVEVREDAVVVELIAEVEEVVKPEAKQQNLELTAEEREQLIKLWESWDVLLVRLLETMANESIRPEDRQVLIDVLLDTRYVFSAALDQQDLRKDFVRSQFLSAWQQLAPVFRRQLYTQPSQNSLGYLAFFTAADALAVLDRMGPTLGIEISQQGLLRLAEMLDRQNAALPYGPQLDKKLRELLQLPPENEEAPSPDNFEDIEIPEKNSKEGPLSQVFDFFLKPAFGAERPDLAEILRWKVPDDNLDEYLARVREVLADSSEALLARGDIPKQFHGMFKNLIPAMAWQESCFKQFVIKDKKLTYLLSYNQSSVGLMQINERVWRGVYDRNRLRWDIHYNALAGCEIADLYLRDYALKHSEWKKKQDMELLSRVVYAMYNGGPAEYGRFLARERSGKHYRSDLLFLEKLQWSIKKKWEHIQDCL